MHTLLAIYIAVFALFHVIMFSVEVFWTQASERDPVLESVIDGFIAVILLLGMIFLYIEAENPKLKLIWAFLAPTGFAVQFWLSRKARTRDFNEKTGELSSPSRGFADISTLALYLPALALNCLFAFGG